MAGKQPLGLRWRSSYWFVTLVVFLGIAVDLLVYSIVVPVFPFRFAELGYSNVSSLTGWLLFAYSAGLVLSTFPIAWYSERNQQRKWPLVSGLVVIIGSQILLMEAPTFAVMCVARVLQGIGSTIVWVLGLALLCESTPTQLIGRQLGIVVAGNTLGLLLGPAIGGALFDSLGFRAPFIFGVIAATLDLIGRLLILERREALQWGHDPASLLPEASVDRGQTHSAGLTDTPVIVTTADVVNEQEKNEPTSSDISLWTVFVIIVKSHRAMVACLLAAVYGLMFSAQDPTLPVHLAEVWGLKPTTVGLVFLAMVAATLITSPVAGWMCDRMPSGWVVVPCLILSVPWWGISIIEGHLALFIVAFAIQSGLTGAAVAPITAELASVVRNDPRIGYAHIYGLFNIAFGVGSALGPIYGSQIFDHVARGWMVLCVIAIALMIVSVVLAICFVDEKPLLYVALEKLRSSKTSSRQAEQP